jgi:hypothetical protein
MTISPPFVNRLSIKYGIHDSTQPYRPLWPVTRIVLFLFFTSILCSERFYCALNFVDTVSVRELQLFLIFSNYGIYLHEEISELFNYISVSSKSGLESREYGLRDPSSWPRGTFYQQKLALSSPINGGSSVGVVRSWTQATELCFFVSH